MKVSVKNQKIAAFGSSYRERIPNVGAAEGCDLLLLFPEMDGPAGFFGVLKQYGIRIHYVREIHF